MRKKIVRFGRCLVRGCQGAGREFLSTFAHTYNPLGVHEGDVWTSEKKTTHYADLMSMSLDFKVMMDPND